jgi:hypothetical protein
MTDRSFGVKSTDFDRLLTLVESLQNRYNTTTDRAEETRVLVGDVAGDVTDATKRKLAVSARENATAYVLNAKGPLAQDARTHGFTSAHLVDVRVGSPRNPQLEAAGAPRAAFKAAAADEAGGEEELVVDVVRKPNEERPQFRMVRHYAFDFQVLTENYLPYLTPQKPKPQAAPAGEVPHVL